MKALVAALRARPDDEALWLVFADALLDAGDVRGELIHLQHRLDRADLTAEQRADCARRADALERVHRWRWLQDLEPLPAAQVRWRSGFVRRIGLSWGPTVRQDLAAWLDHAAGQLIDGLEFVDDRELGDPEVQDLAGWPELTRLAGLGLRRTGVRSEGIRALADSPHLAGLRRLDLRGSYVAADGLRPLARGLRSLTHLDLAHCGLGEEGVGWLDGASRPGLVSLDLSHNAIGTEGVRSVTGALTGLQRLELSQNHLDPSAASALVEAAGWGQLQVLGLSNNRLGDRGATALARTPAPALRVLRLQGNDLGPRGVRALVGGGVVAGVEQLDLRWNRLGAAGAEALAAAGPGRLSKLVLDRNEIGDAGLQALAGRPVVAGLAELCLGRNHVGDRGLAALLRAAPPALRSLDLWHNDLGPRGAAILADCAGLTGLARLDLGGNRIGSEGVAAIAGSPHLARLESLDLWHTSMGDVGAEALAAASLDRLAHLDLTYNFITDRGARALAGAPWLGRARVLDLRRNEIGAGGREELRRVAQDQPDLRIMV